MPDFVDDPDFAIRWPPHLFADEAERLIRRAREVGTGDGWADDVELLLRQAFSTSEPAEAFNRILKSFSGLPVPAAGYQDDEEPF